LPKGLKSGDTLLGSYSLVGEEDARKAVQYPISYALNEVGSKRHGKALTTVIIEPKKAEKKDPQTEFSGKQHLRRTITKSCSEKVRDLNISLLSSLKDDQFAANVFKELEQENPEYLPLLLAQLKRLNENRAAYQEMLDLAQKIVDLAKPDEVLQHMGARNDDHQENLLKKE
jgi:hypothetical protein